MRILTLVIALLTTQLLAAPVYYAQWSATPITENGVSKYVGTIDINGVSVTVKYTASSTLAGIDAGPGSNFNLWNSLSTLPSPYISSYVSNLPPAYHIIKIKYAQSNYFEFSRPVQGVVLAVVSMNGNAYIFDDDFTIYSAGDGTTRASGYWGPGTLVKTQTAFGKYNLSGAGEPHGVVGFDGSYTSLYFESTNFEDWNGFNIGIFGLTPKTCPYNTVDSTINPTTGQCGAPAAQCYKLLNSLPVKTQSEGFCKIQNSGSALVTLSIPGQKVYLSARSDGATSPYFDDLAVLRVLTPSKQVFGRNYVVYEKDCKDMDYIDISLPTAQNNQVVDVSYLFNNEAGQFSVSISVINKLGGYANSDLFICTGPSVLTTSPLPFVAETAEVEAAVSGQGAGAGLSVGEIVAICVGSVVGTVLLLAGIGFVGYRVASSGSKKSELDEKFVLN